MKVCLIGAGASYGYKDTGEEEEEDDDNCIDVFCPPMSCNILTRAVDLGLLTEQSYPRLYSAVQHLVGTDEPLESVDDSELEYDIEKFLTWVIRSSERPPNQDRLALDREDSDLDYKEAVRASSIGETYDFLYDFFRLYSVLYSPEFYDDNYRRLIRHHDDEPLCFISMNYDILLEQALRAEGFNKLSWKKGVYNKVAPVFKLHGSVNWLYPTQSNTNRSIFHRNKRMGNRFCRENGSGTDMQRVMSLTIEEVKNTPSWLLPPYRRPFSDHTRLDFIPAMIPPLGDLKERSMFDLNLTWDSAAYHLNMADELIIIGCSLREKDKGLRELLRENLRDDVTVSIAAGGDSEEIKTTFEGWLDNPSCKTYGYFRNYLDSVEE